MAGLKPPEGGVAPPMGVPKLESVVEVSPWVLAGL